MERKSFKAAVKVSDAGHVVVRFAKLNVVDKGGDMTLPGAFQQGQEVRISAYNHSSWGGALPVGKGAIREEGDDAIFEGDFFTETETGKEHYLTVKAMGPLQEWSYGFNVLNDGHTDVDGTTIRLLKKLDTFEVSPVLLGQGIGTQTLDVKAANAPEDKASLKVMTKSIAHAKALIRAGHVDRDSSWSFDAEDGNALLGKNGDDWENYALYFLAEDTEANDETKARYRYPYGKEGKVYRRAVIAAKSRASAQDQAPVADAADSLLKLIDKDKDDGKSLSFQDQASGALAGVRELMIRAQAIKTMRAQKGEDLGAQSRALLADVSAEVEALLDELKSLGDEPPTAEADALEALATAALAEAELSLTRIPQ